jgi:hypothetical protein
MILFMAILLGGPYSAGTSAAGIALRLERAECLVLGAAAFLDFFYCFW